MKVPNTYFCSYDDFIELHRAAFEDSADQSRIVTTSHFNSYKYRPLNRLINFLTYKAGDFDPTFFRTKNLAFHLLNVILIYVLGWKLFGSIAISATGALFFGLHPVANQTIAGAVVTNSISHAAFLGAVLMLMRSMDSTHWAMWLSGGVFFGWLSLMAYDVNIVVFGLMLLWLILNWARVGEHLNHSRIIILFGGLSGGLLAVYFGLRYLYVSQGVTQAASDWPPAGVILKNTIMYIGSLLLPVDVVLASEWLKAPLPSEIQFHISSAVLSVPLLSLIGVSVAVSLLYWMRAHVSRRSDYIAVAFLLAGIALPLLPVLLFQPRPSETYLYLPMGFYAILLSFGLAKVWRHTGGSKLWTFYVPTVVVLVVLFSSATWIRNNRVFDCGQTAHRILHGLPEKLLKDGRWKVLFANIPGENTTRRYGFYGFYGVDTIGHGAIGNWAITSALQLVYKNRLLIGEIVEPQGLAAKCRIREESGQICVLVHANGSVEIVTATNSH
jgi:hypothetical protein